MSKDDCLRLAGGLKEKLEESKESKITEATVVVSRLEQQLKSTTPTATSDNKELREGLSQLGYV
jgi:hypothetical protein